jgi:hypothetical protein
VATAARVRGTAGPDRLQTVNGVHDLVSCGRGHDLATVDGLDRVAGDCEVVTREASRDPFENGASAHETEVEPDSAAFGKTVVAVFQVGRIFDGGARAIGYAVSHDSGRTWRRGFLPGLTPRASDPAIAYDRKHKVWLAVSLVFGGGGSKIAVNRSTDTKHWGAPVTATATSPEFGQDKEWIACDTWPQSPHYGNCYIEFDDFSGGNEMSMVTSTDGGLTWSPVRTPGCSSGLGGQPVVQPNGNVIVPYSNNGGAESSFRSTNGGDSWSGCTTISGVSESGVPFIRTFSLPSAEVAGDGKVYVAWQDCRFRTGCSSNDIVYSTSMDGLTWSQVTRIPIDPVSSTVDHFLPGIAVDKNTSGSGTHLAVTYYYFPNNNCTLQTCELTVGFTSSLDGGTSWTPGFKIGGPMKVPWIANTNQGYMVGDYISTSFTGDGKAHPVFSLAKPPDSGPNGSCYPNNSGCHQRMTSATFDITLPPPTPAVQTRREPVARGLNRHPEAPLGFPTAN